MVYYAVEEWSFHFKELEDISQVIRKGVSFFEKDSKVRHMWQNLYNLPEMEYDSETVPLLHLSVLLNLDSLAEWCLGNDGEHDVETKWGVMAHPALVIACQQRQEYIVSLLLDAGANPLADIYLESALDAALSFCNRRILHLMAQTEPCREFLIENAAKQDGTLIYVAAEVGNEDACRFLVEDLGWDLKWQSGRVGHTALACALSSGNFELISCFLEEWHVSTGDHSDILAHACSPVGSASDFEKTIRLLVDHYSIEINATDVQGHNALCFAIRQNYGPKSSLSTTRILLKFGCSPDQPDCLGRTTMYCHTSTAIRAYMPDFLEFMELLVSSSQHGINRVDLVGQTVLHYLIECWLIQPTDGTVYYESIEFLTQAAQDLIDLGVNRHIQNHQGLTALQVLEAARGQYDERLGVAMEAPRRCLDQTVTILKSYSTVPKY